MSAQKPKIVLFTAPFDQGDILNDFLEWHLDLGVDYILAMDYGSTDGSQEILEKYSKTHPVAWFPIPDPSVSMVSGAAADMLAAIARDQHGADWIIHCDVDEFLRTTGSDLRTILAEADRDGVTMLTVPRRTMTGPLLRQGQRATQALTLRVDSTLEPTHEQQLSWDLPAPFVFLDVGGHLVVKASALDHYGHGAHVATTTWGRSITSDQLVILHYALRDFEALLVKVHKTAAWLDDNKHLLGGTLCWHWRRWIRLWEEGRLKEEYDQHFMSSERAQMLVEAGICSVDTTIADWIAEQAVTRETAERTRT